MTSPISSNTLPSATSAFISAFAKANELPPPNSVLDSSTLQAISFDWYTMYWFSFLANVLDTTLEDFANKMNFVSTIQQNFSDINTVFEKVKSLTSFGENGGITISDINELSNAFYSLVRIKNQLTAPWLLTAYPDGVPYKYNLSLETGVGRVKVTQSGVVIGSATPDLYYVPNPFKDSGLAAKISTLLSTLQQTNFDQTRNTGYSSVTSYFGNLVTDLLQFDTYLATPTREAFYTPWSPTVWEDTGDPSTTSDAYLQIIANIEALATQYISWQNAAERYVKTTTSSILSNASTTADAAVTEAQSISSEVEIELDQFEQIENMYSNVRSQVQQTIADRNLVIVRNSLPSS